MREACGGAGFSQFSALPYLLTDYAAKVAYEGDNTVMLQQSAKYLMKGVLKRKKLLGEFLAYLNDLEAQFASLPVPNKHSDLSTLDAVGDALRVRAAYLIYRQLLRGFAVAREQGVPTKELLHEMYQQD